MRNLRFILTGVLLGTVTVAIAAAPGTKKPSTARVSPPVTAGVSSGSDLVQPANIDQSESGNAATPVNDPATEFAIPAERPVSSPTAASAAGGDPINMNWYSINNGGAIEVASGNIKMGLSIGQNAVGEVSAGNIKMGLGFWYGAGAASPSCACDCHADPNCSGDVNISDVTLAVNVAFRNDPAIVDPNVLCPYETTDVTCDGGTNISDVTHIVNVAFRNADPALEFCQPCSLAPNL